MVYSFGASLEMDKRNVKVMSNKGQVAVEYILLLAVGVMIWLMLVKGLVSRDPNSPGMIIKKWTEIIQFIGEDKIEK